MHRRERQVPFLLIEWITFWKKKKEQEGKNLNGVAQQWRKFLLNEGIFVLWRTKKNPNCLYNFLGFLDFCRYIALGANTGSVYIYDRPDAKLKRELKHREMLASTEGEVSCLKFSPSQALLAVGFLKGAVLVFELNFEQAKEKPKV